VTKFFEGDENFVRRKIMSDDRRNFCPRRLASSGCFTGQKLRNLLRWGKFCLICFVR